MSDRAPRAGDTVSISQYCPIALAGTKGKVLSRPPNNLGGDAVVQLEDGSKETLCVSWLRVDEASSEVLAAMNCAIGRDGLVTTWTADRGIVELGRGLDLESCLAIVRLHEGAVMPGWNGLLYPNHICGVQAGDGIPQTCSCGVTLFPPIIDM